MIKIEELNKLNLAVGQIREINKDFAVIFYNGKEYKLNIKINAEKGDKIVISLISGKMLVPLLDENIPIIPEKDIEAGSKVQ